MIDSLAVYDEDADSDASELSLGEMDDIPVTVHWRSATVQNL